MKRFLARHFPPSESYDPNDPKAKEFEEFLRANLDRLKYLGKFRNWFIINNQGVILDDKRPPPLDLGLKILEEAYKAVDIEKIADWLSKRLPENQLEESIHDSRLDVKAAFIKYVIDQVNRALPIWRLQLDIKNHNIDTDLPLKIPKDISDQFWKLAEDNRLAPVEMHGGGTTGKVRIYKNILDELYFHGVAHDQLPDLKTLAEFMNADYKKYGGYMTISADLAKISALTG